MSHHLYKLNYAYITIHVMHITTDNATQPLPATEQS